jgi:ribosomal protein S18 acetylase RimI-like enzyme
VEVRRATVADARDIAEIHVRAWQVAYRHAFPAEKLDALSIEERAARWQRTVRDQTVYVAADGETLLGWACGGPATGEETEGELYGLYVAPEAWGRGAGQALIGRIEDDLAGAHDEALLWVLEDNPRARHFYELAGWRLDGGRKRETYLGVEVDVVRYRKALRAEP